MTIATRATDELHLAEAGADPVQRLAGDGTGQHGKVDNFAAVTISRIRSADLAESGEPPELVLAAYPTSRSNPAKGKP